MRGCLQRWQAEMWNVRKRIVDVLLRVPSAAVPKRFPRASGTMTI